MIHIMDQARNLGIKIVVSGRPRNYQVKVGRNGKWTVKRGRYAGEEREGEQWDKSLFYRSLRTALTGTCEAISELLGYPQPIDPKEIEGVAGWQKAIEEEEKLLAMVEQVHEKFQYLLDQHPNDLARLSKEEAKGIEDDDDDTGGDE